MDVTFATLQRNRCFVVKMSGNVHSVREWWRRLSFFTVNLYTFVHFSRLWVQTVDKSMQIYRCNLKSFFFRIAKYMVLDIFQTKSGHFIREWWICLFFSPVNMHTFVHFSGLGVQKVNKHMQFYRWNEKVISPLSNGMANFGLNVTNTMYFTMRNDFAFAPLERNGLFLRTCIKNGHSYAFVRVFFENIRFERECRPFLGGAVAKYAF